MKKKLTWGKWLKAELSKRNMTGADLSREAKISESTVSFWLNERKVAHQSMRHLVRYALLKWDKANARMPA